MIDGLHRWRRPCLTKLPSLSCRQLLRPLEPLDPEREINWTLSYSMLPQMLRQMLLRLHDAAAASFDAVSALMMLRQQL